MKTVLIIRLGALGDIVIITPLLRLLKQDGYHVTVNISNYSKAILDNNPYVDELIIHDSNIKNSDLGAHWEKISKGYDRIINLSGSIEESLLKKATGHKLAEATRESLNDANYSDETLRLGGYEDKQGLNGELFLSKEEERFARNFRKKYRKCFLVIWALSGSSAHKSYPYAEYVAQVLLDQHSDIVFITVGDDMCQLLEWKHKRTKNKAGRWSIRKSIAIAKYADLIVTPQTAMSVISSCFDTPKLVLLSHSTCNNLCKYWNNHFCVHADVDCYPCHQLHYSSKTCSCTDKVLKTPVCMTELNPDVVYNEIEKQYNNWRN